jgi:hypothetical protein
MNITSLSTPHVPERPKSHLLPVAGASQPRVVSERRGAERGSKCWQRSRGMAGQACDSQPAGPFEGALGGSGCDVVVHEVVTVLIK